MPYTLTVTLSSLTKRERDHIARRLRGFIFSLPTVEGKITTKYEAKIDGGLLNLWELGVSEEEEPGLGSLFAQSGPAQDGAQDGEPVAVPTDDTQAAQDGEPAQEQAQEGQEAESVPGSFPGEQEADPPILPPDGPNGETDDSDEPPPAFGFLNNS